MSPFVEQFLTQPDAATLFIHPLCIEPHVRAQPVAEALHLLRVAFVYAIRQKMRLPGERLENFRTELDQFSKRQPALGEPRSFERDAHAVYRC